MRVANEIADLRLELFKALRGLTDTDAPMDIERAKAVADIGQTIINSAKVEVDYLKTIGGGNSAFMEGLPEKPALPAGTSMVGAVPGVTVTRHKLKG
jgi:hypothetical protein